MYFKACLKALKAQRIVIKIIYNSLSFVRFYFMFIRKFQFIFTLHVDAFKWIKNNFDLND